MMVGVRYGRIVGVSNDKGPHKLLDVVADGKRMTVKLWETSGFHSAPVMNGEIAIFSPDGDDGLAFGMAMPPAKDRVDGQKPGELTIKDFASGNTVAFKANGDIETTVKNDDKKTVKGKATVKADGAIEFESPAGITLKGPITIDGDIQHTGNMTTSGVHVDANGTH